MIEFILTLSVLLNFGLIWYIAKLLRTVIQIEDGFEELKTELLEFATHLRAINKVESFYGDPTITALVEHMKKLAGYIERYSKVMVVFEDDIEEQEEKENGRTEEKEEA